MIREHFSRFGSQFDVILETNERRAYVIYDNPISPTLALAVLSRYETLERVYSTPLPHRVHFYPSDEQFKSGLRIQPNANLENECFDHRTKGCIMSSVGGVAGSSGGMNCFYLHKEQNYMIDRQPVRRVSRC